MHVKSKSGRVFRIPSDEEDARIRAGIADDPDAVELSDAELSQLSPLDRSGVAANKQPVSIRLSPEVVAYFKAGGKGWQTRIDEVLRDYVRGRS